MCECEDFARVADSVLTRSALSAPFCTLSLSQEYEALKEEVCQLSAHRDELERKLKALRQSREEKERKVSERREGRRKAHCDALVWAAVG